MPESRVRHFMTESVITTIADTPLAEVATTMSESRVSCVVVCDGAQPLGVITERDVTRACARDVGASPDRKAASAMSQGVFSLPVDARCTEAMEVLSARGFRYGGEEFLAVFPEVSADGAAIAAEHVRAAVEALAVPHSESPIGHLSISLGVAAENVAEPCWPTLVARADQALYQAKDRGRNRVEVSRESASVSALCELEATTA